MFRWPEVRTLRKVVMFLAALFLALTAGRDTSGNTIPIADVMKQRSRVESLTVDTARRLYRSCAELCPGSLVVLRR